MKCKHLHSKSYVYLCTNSDKIGVYVQNLIKTALYINKNIMHKFWRKKQCFVFDHKFLMKEKHFSSNMMKMYLFINWCNIILFRTGFVRIFPGVVLVWGQFRLFRWELPIAVAFNGYHDRESTFPAHFPARSLVYTSITSSGLIFD